MGQERKINILGIDFSDVSSKDLEKILEETINLNKKIKVCDVNTQILYLYHTDPNYKNYIKTCDYILPDGMSIIVSSKIFRKPLKERLAGIDVMEKIVEISYRKDYKIYLLGAKEEVVKKAAEILNKKFEKNVVVGYRDGYFEKDDYDLVIDDINQKKSNILFVGISYPKREDFISYAFDKLNVNFIMGVGGSFEVLAGVKKRAPKWAQKIGMEWFYRMIQDPKDKFKRYLISHSYYVYLNLKYLFKKD
jgi:N-acetylglucosaminyldiphosphoundecaprenol N-acetyl-beta-D-mannosaminyltransferase